MPMACFFLHFQNLVKRSKVFLQLTAASQAMMLVVDRQPNMCEMTAQLNAGLSEHGAEMKIFKRLWWYMAPFHFQS